MYLEFFDIFLLVIFPLFSVVATYLYSKSRKKLIPVIPIILIAGVLAFFVGSNKLLMFIIFYTMVRCTNLLYIMRETLGTEYTHRFDSEGLNYTLLLIITTGYLFYVSYASKNLLSVFSIENALILYSLPLLTVPIFTKVLFKEIK